MAKPSKAPNKSDESLRTHGKAFLEAFQKSLLTTVEDVAQALPAKSGMSLFPGGAVVLNEDVVRSLSNFTDRAAYLQSISSASVAPTDNRVDRHRV